MKIFALSLLALGAFWSSGSAFAAPVLCPNGSTTITYLVNLGTYDPVEDKGGCLQHDKIWSGFSFTTSGFPSDSSPTLSYNNFATFDLHYFNLNFTNGFINTSTVDPITSTFSYNLQIDPFSTDYASNKIYLAKLMFDLDYGSASVADTITTSSGSYLLTTNGQEQFLGGTVKSLTATNVLTIQPESKLNSVTNYYYQTKLPLDLPEPGSLSLMGIGLAASLAFGKRRKAKS
jgi:hypothetical protein